MKEDIAIVGAGPSGLFMLMKLLEFEIDFNSITVFDKSSSLGSGMPYSFAGANLEHVTNVSGNEIPAIRSSLLDWLKNNRENLFTRFNFDVQTLNDYKVVPRLIFGEYLKEQFKLLVLEAERKGIDLKIYSETEVLDIIYLPDQEVVLLETQGKGKIQFDRIVICTGHAWPVSYEGKQPGYFDSPYPPSKLQQQLNHSIAITGSSLTAIDAVRTLARQNGSFFRDEHDVLCYHHKPESERFNIVMYSKHGLLPAIRFHLEDPHLSKAQLLSKQALQQHRQENQGFISLDFVFEKDFKEQILKKDIDFYTGIKDMNLESFVSTMMDMREKSDVFQFFKAEYHEAQLSIEHRKSIYWKELLAILSFAMNYPAKYFSAEDTLRLQEVLMPLIGIVIAFVPQYSCEELIALHESGRLKIVASGDTGKTAITSEKGIVYQYIDEQGVYQQAKYSTYINCTGQRHLPLENFPFKGLLNSGAISSARVQFRSTDNALKRRRDHDKNVEESNGSFFLKLPGIAITDNFQIIGTDGNTNDCVYIMAVPFIGGFNPDYSGLDFCEEASNAIAQEIKRKS